MLDNCPPIRNLIENAGQTILKHVDLDGIVSYPHVFLCKIISAALGEGTIFACSQVFLPSSKDEDAATTLG